jgi:hypothetical protein
MANWQKFIQDFSNYLASNQSKGPFDTGKKLAEYYVNTIKGAKAIPAGNKIDGNIAQSFRPILDLGFGLGFFLLQNSQKTFKQLQKDKNYYDGSSPIPPEQEKKALTEEPQSEGFTLSEFFNLLTTDDLEDIRKNSTVNFFLHETTGKESRKIFNYKEPFNFEKPENTRVAIFGNTLEKAKDNIISYGFLGAINTILEFNSDYDYQDAQDEIKEDYKFEKLTFRNLLDALARTNYQDSLLLLNQSIIDNTGNANSVDAVRADFGILAGLYAAELEAWINIITPYIQKRFTGSQDEEYTEGSKLTPAALGISTDGTDFIPLINENSTFPTVSSSTVTTIGNFQKEAQFKIALSSGGIVSILRDVTLSGIQSALAGTPVIDIRFTLTGSESLNVVITDLATRAQERFTISEAFGSFSYPAGSQDKSYRFPPDGPIIPSNKVQEQNAVKSAKDSVKNLLGSLPPDAQQKLINFGLDAKIADLVSKGDPYLVMASSVVLYWTLVGLVPICFASNPPIPPASIPAPGIFTILFPGLPITLSKKIRLALNVGLDPSIFPILDPSGSIQKSAVFSNSRESKEFQALLKAIESQNIGLKAKTDAKIIPIGVSTKLALAFATHLLSLKFLYTGSTQAGPATIPTPGFVLSVF